MPQSHFQGSPANKDKSTVLASIWTLWGFLNLCLMIWVVVMVQFSCKGHRLGNPSGQCEKDLPGNYWGQSRHLQVIPDARQMLFPRGSPAKHLQGIWRASAGHLGVTCRCLPQKFWLFSLTKTPDVQKIITPSFQEVLDALPEDKNWQIICRLSVDAPLMPLVPSNFLTNPNRPGIFYTIGGNVTEALMW